MLRDVLIEERSLRVRPADPSRPPPKGRRARIAITWYRVIERRADVTRLAIKLGTGRRHQIRVQLAKLGHPVVGDVRHGARRDPLRRLCLHATRLGFRHPDTGAPVEFESAPPAEFASVGRPAERRRAARPRRTDVRDAIGAAARARTLEAAGGPARRSAAPSAPPARDRAARAAPGHRRARPDAVARRSDLPRRGRPPGRAARTATPSARREPCARRASRDARGRPERRSEPARRARRPAGPRRAPSTRRAGRAAREARQDRGRTRPASRAPAGAVRTDPRGIAPPASPADGPPDRPTPGLRRAARPTVSPRRRRRDRAAARARVDRGADGPAVRGAPASAGPGRPPGRAAAPAPALTRRGPSATLAVARRWRSDRPYSTAVNVRRPGNGTCGRRARRVLQRQDRSGA